MSVTMRCGTDWQLLSTFPVKRWREYETLARTNQSSALKIYSKWVGLFNALSTVYMTVLNKVESIFINTHSPLYVLSPSEPVCIILNPCPLYLHSRFSGILLCTQMWLKEAEDVTWDRFMEGLTATEQTKLAERVKDRLSQYHDQQKSIKLQPLETKEVRRKL